MPDFHAAAQALAEELVTRRRDFHRHPELGFQEVRTAGIVAKELTELGLEVQTGVGKTGVVGLLEGDQPGPTVLLRFDMDALPIVEANTTDYISTNAGVMHACGHDGHTAVGLGVAKMLAPYRDALQGRLKFVFQPAEEGLGGARAMIADGVLANPEPDYALGLHVWNDKPVGWVAATPGACMAAADAFECTITGAGGHGASPYQTRDPIVAAAQIIAALQTIPARNVDARESTVVSVTTVHAGDAFNIIPGETKLTGTVRTYAPAIRELTQRRMHEIVTGIAAAMNCEATLTFRDSTEAVVNDAEVAAVIRDVAQGMPGVAEVVDDERTMGAEDYGEFMSNVPGCFFFVGSNNAAEDKDFPHHHPRFDFDERALVLGAALMATSAARYVMPD
ncbi:MAG: M20 family metallopeptidase [Anaerolineales bacterium]